MWLFLHQLWKINFQHIMECLRAFFHLIQTAQQRLTIILYGIMKFLLLLSSSLKPFVLFSASRGVWKGKSSCIFSLRVSPFAAAYNDVLVRPPLHNRCGISQSIALQGPASSLALVPLSNQCGVSQLPPSSSRPSVLASTPPDVWL